MEIESTPLPGLLILTPYLHPDDRGFLYESYSRQKLKKAGGPDYDFVQDNHSYSHRHVLRGMHYQKGTPQAKFVRAIRGSVFDVCIDMRRSSPTWGQWYGVELSAENRRQIFIPAGFAHGFLTLSDESEVLYKLSEPYLPDQQRSVRWDDPAVGIRWPLTADPILSEKDRTAPAWADADMMP